MSSIPASVLPARPEVATDDSAQPASRDEGMLMSDGRRPIRTVIVDDNAHFLRAVEVMLKDIGTVEVVGRATMGEGALDLVARLKPDLVLLDLLLPGMNGDAAARCITAASPSPKVVLMSLFFTEGVEKRLQATGAHGFVDKEHFVEQIKPLLARLFDTEQVRSTAPPAAP